MQCEQVSAVSACRPKLRCHVASLADAVFQLVNMTLHQPRASARSVVIMTAA